MITGNIKDFERYLCMHKSFPDAFEYMKSCLVGDTIIINTENVKGSVSVKKTNEKYSSTGNLELEAHRKYIDIHFIIDGAERFAYADISKLSAKNNYDEENDYQLLEGEYDILTLKRGDFIITYPEDAHAPALKYNNVDTVKRTVIKIKL